MSNDYLPTIIKLKTRSTANIMHKLFSFKTIYVNINIYVNMFPSDISFLTVLLISTRERTTKYYVLSTYL